ncbi:MAG: methionyl-tRNA formyltransferase [Verrucomicrobia bacterium]|nr:MAG: methionyl-tRNA formyltransferase [Verrucomicrobiota bacterium]
MRVVFIGTGEIGVPTLHALLGSEEHQLAAVVTQPDKPVGREQRIEPSPIKKALAGTKIPILQPARIKDRQSIEEISARSPQAIIVMAYGQILPRGILETPRVACLNLHASLLPRHRGAAPIQAAIASGDPETGITVMYMDEGLDTGDILLQRKIDILPTETGGSLHDRLGQIAPDALLESLQLLAKETAPRIPQNNALATYAPKLNRNDGKIDWSQPADILERKIRAFNPWPGAFTTVTAKSGKPRNLKIFSASIVDLVGKAGEILQTGKRGLVIAASDRALSLEEVQPEGKRRMTSAEFLHGFEAASWG